MFAPVKIPVKNENWKLEIFITMPVQFITLFKCMIYI